MKQLFSGVMLAAFIFSGSTLFAQDRGEDLFNQTCVACHTIGGGRIIGPDLADVHSRRNEAWIISFIQSPQSFANSGNADAVALLAEFNGLVMPDQALSDDEIRSIIGFIARTSPAGGAVAEPTAEVVTPADQMAASVQLGQNLFVGKVRFENSGSSCNSCHTVDNSNVMTGGSLAINLTDAVSRLTRTGVDAMMASPPFPAMRDAFKGKALTESERTAIIDFLQASEQDRASVTAPNIQGRFLLFGGMGLLVLLALFFVIGLRGSKDSVNQAIYDRQITST